MTGPGADAASERGFTLIEALVALAIGGFVIATLATITGQWMRSWRAGLPTLQRSEALVASLDRIAADLSAARMIPAGPAGPGLVFSADATSVSFVRRTLPVEAPAGLELVRLAPLAGDTTVTLARSRSAFGYGSSARTPMDTAPVVLIRQPYAIRFAYADADAAWRASWSPVGRLPRLIRIELLDRRSGRPALAPIVVAVHAQAPVACAAATSAQRCDAAMGFTPDREETIRPARPEPAAAGSL